MCYEGMFSEMFLYPPDPLFYIRLPAWTICHLKHAKQLVDAVLHVCATNMIPEILWLDELRKLSH